MKLTLKPMNPTFFTCMKEKLFFGRNREKTKKKIFFAIPFFRALDKLKNAFSEILLNIQHYINWDDSIVEKLKNYIYNIGLYVCVEVYCLNASAVYKIARMSYDPITSKTRESILFSTIGVGDGNISAIHIHNNF